MIDRFDAMALHLLGEPLPALPAIQGRVHRLVAENDPDDVDPPTVAELVARLGLTRQGAFLRLQRFEQTVDRAGLLKPKSSTGRADGVAPARSSLHDHERIE